MKTYYQENLPGWIKRNVTAVFEAAKVLSAMALVFCVLAIMGPLTSAAQYAEHLF
jgi:hypothetical protein